MAETAQSPLWAEDPAPQVTLVAESDEETLAIWPHQFEARYTVSVVCFSALGLPKLLADMAVQ